MRGRRDYNDFLSSTNPCTPKPSEFLPEASRHAKSLPGRIPSQPPSLLQLKHISLNSEIPLKKSVLKPDLYSQTTPEGKSYRSVQSIAEAEDFRDLSCSWHQFPICLRKKKNLTTIWCLWLPYTKEWGRRYYLPLNSLECHDVYESCLRKQTGQCNLVI